MELYSNISESMKLHITDKSSISSLQKEFNSEFPFLRIEFFKKMHKPGEGLSKNVMYTSDKLIGEIRSIRKNGDLDVQSDMLVSELEAKFGNDFGLSVQVFRKSGNVWLETTRTDNWTLRQQNDEGESLHNHFGLDNKDDYDYHEQE